MNERTEQAMRRKFEEYIMHEYPFEPTTHLKDSHWKTWQAAQASIATPQPQTVRSALKILDRALIEPLSADEHNESGSLLKEPNAELPDGCYCKPGKCAAPVIMGRQMPCRDPAKGNPHE